VEPGSLAFWLYLLVMLLLILLGAIVAGLLLGYLSLDDTNLRILMTSGDAKQKRYAQRIHPLRKNLHLLLVTLVLVNSLVNTTLPILMGNIFPSGIATVLVSALLVLVFIEVIPQAVCSRYGLQIGAFFVWPVRILIYVFWIITYPISRILDWTVGKSHGTTYQRDELKELVALHGEEGAAGGILSKDEVTIIRGALDLTNKTVGHVMTEMKYVFSIDYNVKLDRETLSKIVKAGHSRIPVYKGKQHELIGVILVKSLILLDPDDATPLKDIRVLSLPKVDIKTSLFSIMDSFQEGKSHMAIVVDMSDPQRMPLGIITLEDVIEELIQEEIVDETDVFVDVTKRVKVLRALNTGVNGIASNLSLTPPTDTAERLSMEESSQGVGRKKIFSTKKGASG